MKRLLTASLLLLLSASCGSDSEEEKNSKNANSKENTVVSTDAPLNQASLVGIYEGNLPCEGCDGMLTTIILREDNSYAITTQPVGDTAFVMPLIDSGNFVMKDTILELTDKGGGVKQYKIGANKLEQLGDDGQALNTSGDDKYVFNRKQNPAP